MRLSQLITLVNNLADEDASPAIVSEFINDAIARINIECNTNFPSLQLNTDDEPVFPEKWQRTLLIPFALGRLKQQDSSQFEYSDAYQEFLTNLYEFKYKIPERFIDDEEETATFEPDVFKKPPYFWSGW